MTFPKYFFSDFLLWNNTIFEKIICSRKWQWHIPHSLCIVDSVDLSPLVRTHTTGHCQNANHTMVHPFPLVYNARAWICSLIHHFQVLHIERSSEELVDFARPDRTYFRIHTLCSKSFSANSKLGQLRY